MMSSVVRLTEAEQRTLGSMLWQYRSVLERVEFLLEAQLMFASSGRDKRLASIADLLEDAVMTINELDLRRELLLHGDTDDPSRAVPTLAEISEAAEQPWSSMFAEHQRWFELCVERIQQLLAQSRQTMGTTLDLINQLVTNEQSPALGGYDRNGRSVRSTAPAVLFDSRA
jgi:hypothetical protein